MTKYRPTVPVVQESPKFANTFNNDGSFLENFKKVTEAAKIKDDEVAADKSEDVPSIDNSVINSSNTTSIQNIEYPYGVPPPTLNIDNSFPSDLHSIPPPKVYVLNEIPDPRELDLNAIPKPELNLDIIKIPDVATSQIEDNVEKGDPEKGE